MQDQLPARSPDFVLALLSSVPISVNRYNLSGPLFYGKGVPRTNRLLTKDAN